MAGPHTDSLDGAGHQTFAEGVESSIEAIAKEIHKFSTIKEEVRSNTSGGQVTAEEAEVAREELSKSSKKVRWGLDQVFHYALAGDKEAVSRAAQEAVPLVAEFRTTVGQYAGLSGDAATQQLILDMGAEAVTSAAELVATAHRTVLNPANPLVTMNLLQSSHHAGKSLKATLLSNPDLLVINAHKLTKSLGEELSEFQAALDALQVSPLPGQYQEVVSSHLKEADSKVKDKINVVVTSALGADKPSTDNATKDTVLALEDYKNATKEVATIMSDKNIQKKIIDAAHEVLSRSGDMFLEAQNVLKTPGNEANARRLQDTARHVASVMKELEKTYIFGAPGQEQYVSALNIMNHATKELQHPSPVAANDRDDDISTLKTRLTTSTMEMAQLAQDILTRSHSDPDRLDGLAPRLAQQYKNLISDVNSLLRVAGAEEGEAEETRAQALCLGGNIVQLIEQTCVQSVLPGHGTRQAVAARACTVAENSVKLLTSANTVGKVSPGLHESLAQYFDVTI